MNHLAIMTSIFVLQLIFSFAPKKKGIKLKEILIEKIT